MKELENMIKKIIYKGKNLICRLYNAVIFRINGIVAGKKCIVTGRIKILNKGGKIRIGNGVTIHSGRYDIPIGFENRVSFWVRKGAEIEIGDNCGLSNTVLCSNKRIVLGKHVLLGGGVKIYDTDFHSLDYMQRRELNNDFDRKSADVVIEDDVFIGAGSFILKGVHIGARSIVGAGSVVRCNIPCDEIWTGNPAQFVRKL